MNQNSCQELQHTHFLLLNRVEIENANTISSPLTYGFPAITAFLGALHSANRQLQLGSPQKPALPEVQLDGILVAHHEHDLHTHQRNRFAEHTFNQQRTPLIRKGSKVETAPIIEEGRQRLTVSLVIGIDAEGVLAEVLEATLIPRIREILFTQRIAGGAVFNVRDIELFSAQNEETLQAIKRKLMPSFILMDRSSKVPELLATLQETMPEATGLDLLLELSKIHHIPHIEEEESTTKADEIDKKRVASSSTKSDKVRWESLSIKQGQGWLVPIPIGFQAIGELFAPGELPHARTDQYPSQYVESIYSVAEWQFSGRLTAVEDALWYDESDPDAGLYLAVQDDE